MKLASEQRSLGFGRKKIIHPLQIDDRLDLKMKTCNIINQIIRSNSNMYLLCRIF